MLDKIDYVKEKNLLVGIDGGVNDETIYDIEKKHPDIIVSGSFVCGSDDFNLQINKITNHFFLC